MESRRRANGLARKTAGFAANAIFSLVVLNLALAAYYGARYSIHARHMGDNPVLQRYPSAGPTLKMLYPTMSTSQQDRLMWETWGRSFTPNLYLGFAETPFHGKYVNESEHGFRVGASQGPWPPVHDGSLVVFLFGASEAFGYGVTDDQALGSRLQPLLAEKSGRPVSVYNFGQGCYFSTQERLLFEKLLAAGQRPDLAIFVDGLGDFEAAGSDAACLWQKVHSSAIPAPTFAAWARTGAGLLPMKRLALDVWRGFNGSTGVQAHPSPGAPEQGSDDPQNLLPVIDRYFTNKRMIEADAKEFSVRTLFVWRPISSYEYDQKYHIFNSQQSRLPLYAQHGYPLMREAVARTHPDRFLWCADIQKDAREELYIDANHYSPKMTGMLAGCIAGGLDAQQDLLAGGRSKPRE